MTGAAREGLIVEGVTKRFAGVTALEDVSLELQRGRILGLMGPNGSGKSTLVNVMTGFWTPDAGSVTLDGADITGASTFDIARRGVSRSFQTVRLFSSLSVRDNVAAAIRRPGRGIDRVVDALLERLKIAHLADTLASNLAYGLQRRVEIARALATNPSYLLLDEPAAGLNDSESKDLEEIILDTVRDPAFGCGVLIIDHDVRLIVDLCDELHVLSNGRTIATGAPDEVRRHPEVVRAYIGEEPE